MTNLTILVLVVLLMTSSCIEAKKRKKSKQTKPEDPVCRKGDVKTLKEGLSDIRAEMMKCCQEKNNQSSETSCNLEGLAKQEDLDLIIENQNKIQAKLNQIDDVINQRFDKIDETLAKTIPGPEVPETYPQDCSKFPDYTGVKKIRTTTGREFNAYCKEGWLYLMRRFNGSVDFYRTYSEYQSGFGDATGEYFLGLENLVSVLKQGRYTLRVDLKMWPPESNEGYAQYSTFTVADASQGYQLHVGGYTGTAGNSLGNIRYHEGKRFTTKDHDQDTWPQNCAVQFKGAGWYGDCHVANLFGTYSKGPKCPSFATCISWYEWPDPIGDGGNHFYSFREVDMKIIRQSE